MKKILQIMILAGLLYLDSFAAPPLQCAVQGVGNDVVVKVKIVVPHPGGMVVHTPDHRTIWLRADHIPFQYPITDDFEQMSEFVLDSRTQGSWFNNWGEPEAAFVFGVNGTYELYIAENIETERENTLFYTCEFIVSGNDAHEAG